MPAPGGNLGGDLVAPGRSINFTSTTPGLTVAGNTHPQMWAGIGVPAAGLGSSGDFFFRFDGTVANQHIYQKVSGSWTGIS